MILTSVQVTVLALSPLFPITPTPQALNLTPAPQRVLSVAKSASVLRLITPPATSSMEIEIILKFEVFFMLVMVTHFQFHI